jgi:hypothetical protein
MEQVSRRRGGTEGAGRAGRMPEIIRFRDDRFADASAGFVACADGSNHVPSRCVLFFPDGKDTGNDDARRMDDGRIVQVVKVQGVRSGTVPKRRLVHRVLCQAVGEYGRFCPAGGPQHAAENLWGSFA